jgi:transitional endoplasmic reticulum ATPase
MALEMWLRLRRGRGAWPVGDDPFAPALACYAHNLLVATSLRRLAPHVVSTLEDLPLNHDLALPAAQSAAALEDDDLRRKLLRSYVRRHRATRVVAPVSESLRKNLGVIARIVGLDAVELACLQFVLAVSHTRGLGAMLDLLGGIGLDALASVLSVACGEPPHAVREALKPEGRLAGSGLFILSAGADEFTGKLQAKPGLLDLALSNSLTRKTFLARFLPEADAPHLDLTDFPGLRDPLQLAATLLQRTVAARQPGINLLLHGPTGTGKTEACRLLAQAAGLRLCVAGNADDAGESADARKRLSSLLLGQRLFARGGALLLFDELEDLFTWGLEGRGNALMSKQWFNRLLETNPVPVLWVTNRTEGIDPAFLRRFSFAIEFERPGAQQRARILRRHLAGTALPAAAIDALAHQFEANPAQLGTAVATARLVAGDAGPDARTIERVLMPIERLVTGQSPARISCAADAAYDLKAITASEDLVALADRAAAQDCGGLSLCLYGPPGTGKSEFARHLALRMGRPVVARRVSDIESAFVGQTEQRLAQAFSEAERDRALLLFDEADSFLRDRRRSQQSWETTKVNEFLQQLEGYRGVVVCTTNLRESLDSAALRRFTLKIEFGFLKPVAAERVFFGRLAASLDAPATSDQVARGLALLSPLTLGDFGAVQRRLTALGERPTLARMLELLRAEALERGRPERPAGFAAPIAASSITAPLEIKTVAGP